MTSVQPRKTWFLFSLSGWLAGIALLLGGLGASYLKWHETQTYLTVPVLVRDIQAFDQIQPSDLTHRVYPAGFLTSKALLLDAQIVGHYTLVDLLKRKPLTQEQLVEPVRIKDTVAIAIPATPNLTLGGSLKAGDSVDILIMPKTETGKPPAKAVSFSNILVLSVKPGQPSGAVVIALPLDRRNEFIQASASATLWLTRKF